MTQKQFKQILENAGIELDYAAILVQLERLAWINCKEYSDLGCKTAARFENERAKTIHKNLEAAGIYDGFDEQADEVI